MGTLPPGAHEFVKVVYPHLADPADQHREVDRHPVVVVVVRLEKLSFHATNDHEVDQRDVLCLHAQKNIVA